MDAALQARISLALRSGLYLSILTILTGLLIAAATGLDHLSVTAIPVILSAGTLSNGARLTVFAGLVVLVMTPLFRVSVATGFFWARHDRTFTALTLFVLAVLIVTAAFGVFR